MSRDGKVRFLFTKSLTVGLLLVSTAVALLFGELVARLTLNPGDVLLATLVDDPVLGHRIKPHTTGHDAIGFRNLVVPQRADIVGIGDSQTYGVGATRDGSWPFQLSVLLREPVYNMALGGYGPLEYLYLAEHEAKALRPRLLIIGFYLGNDLADAYAAAHQRPYWYGWRDAGSPRPSDQDFYQRSEYVEPKRRFAPVRDWLSRHSVLYSILRGTLLPQLAAWEQDRMASHVPPDVQMAWVDPSNHSIRTIFTPQLRLSVLDQHLPIVQEGLRITRRAYGSLASDAHSKGIKLLVVLIPTKEGAYCSYLQNTGVQLSETFLRLCYAEKQDKEAVAQFFVTRQIAYVDVVGDMEKSIRQHVQIYPKGSDGHPLPAGYRVIARAVYDAVSRGGYDK